jgi:hypothetical protein
VRALSYITVETVFGVWLFMLALLDLGVADVNASAMFPAITLVRHWMIRGLDGHGAEME